MFTILVSITPVTLKCACQVVTSISTNYGGGEGGVLVVNVWKLDYQLLVQPGPITTTFVSSNPGHGDVYIM